ncbi:MAG: TonB-dependent receptor [Saprospiraceae bacterium]|jgi:TonB-dependent receptor
MKKLSFTILFALLAIASFAQNGVIRGTITDEIGLGLPGANVIIQSLTLGTSSDVNGNFTLVNVPVGEQEVIVTFIGYMEIKKTINIEAGKTIIIDVALNPGVLIGGEILVLGDRLKGQAKALNQQKNKSNISNIVSADQIGRFPDANIGDAMKRIPGITMQADQGEARNIIIRGLAPQLNSVTINGERIPSAEGGNRNIQMDLIPSDMIQTIEVNKAVTPDMDADAIGGSVNLITRAASNGMRISGTAASGLNLLTNKPIWTGSLVYGNRFANDKIGLVVSANYNNHDFGSDNVEAEWESTAEDANGEDFDLVYVGEMDIRQYYVQRVRRSISANLDFKLDENNTIYIQSMYNWRNDLENRYRTRYRSIAPTFGANGDIDGWEGEIRRQTKGGGTIYNNRLNDRRLEDQRVLNGMLRGEHLFGNLKLDWSFSVAQASEERPFERYVRYEQGDGLALNYDLNNTEFPSFTAVNATDVALSNFTFDELTEENKYTKELDYNSRIDLSLPTTIANNSGEVKAGFRYRGKQKSRTNNFSEYSPLDGTFDNMSLVSTEDYSKDNYLAGDYNVGTFVTPAFLGQLDLQDATLFEGEDVPSEYLAGNYEANEAILGGYLMWNQDLSQKLSLIAGIRIENTAIEYTGNVLENEENLIRQVSATQNYTNILPGVHLKYNATDNFIIRAAWTNTLARPNYFDLVPYQDIRPDDEELVQGNSNLNPTTSVNFDFMAENYFKSIGLVSAGVFYKSIDDFIYTFVDENYTDAIITGGDTWTRFQPENGGTATLFGAEVAFQRQLDFLPGFWKGFGIYFNYTYTNSTTDGIRNGDGELRTDVALPGTAPHLVNGSLSYENEKLVVRASLNYAHDYVDEVGGSPFSDRYYDRQMFIDLNASYAFTDNLRVFVEANNLTNQPLRYYQGVRERTMQLEYYNARFNVGLKFDLFRK